MSERDERVAAVAAAMRDRLKMTHLGSFIDLGDGRGWLMLADAALSAVEEVGHG